MQKRVKKSWLYIRDIVEKGERLMNKKEFWEIMNTIRTLNEAEMISPENYKQIGRDVFNRYNKQDCWAFSQFLRGYVNELDEYPYAEMACRVVNDFVSDDTVVYFNYWLVSQGEDILLKVVHDPDSINELPNIPWGNAEFELLMGVCPAPVFHLTDVAVQQAIQTAMAEIKKQKTTNTSNYEDFEAVMQDVSNRMPQTIRRAHSEGFTIDEYFDLELTEAERKAVLPISKELEAEYREYLEDLYEFKEHLKRLEYSKRLEYGYLSNKLQMIDIPETSYEELIGQGDWLKELLYLGRNMIPNIQYTYRHKLNKVILGPISFSKEERQKIKWLHDDLLLISEKNSKEKVTMSSKELYETLEQKEKNF